MIEFDMKNIVGSPVFIFVSSLVALWLSARLGAFIRKSSLPLKEVEREDFGVVLTATLTLLGLVIGFSFSMATSRYDQRKNYEEAEANAIGTEYLRADLLPAADAPRVRELLRKYVDQRVLFYTSRDDRQLEQAGASTTQLQKELWSIVQADAAAQPTPVLALAISGMNDVLNSEGYTAASWLNRIPPAAWGLMVAIAVCSNMLVGYVSHKSGALLFLVLPLAASISFLLIADIDSPRSGVIRVLPQNLMRLSQSISTAASMTARADDFPDNIAVPKRPEGLHRP